tara:strand:+ start:1009 stop:1698 length:690 start_codon:yes stop_codon:yes gene_type:complete
MATPGFYNQADQALYDQGNYFLPQEKYRVDLGTSTGVPNRVEFNPSQDGIGSLQEPPYPYPYYGDNQGDQGDQGDKNNIPTGPTGTTQEGITGYDELGNPISNNMSPWSMAKNAFGFITNPLGYLGYKAYGAYKNNQAIKAQDKFYAEKETNQNFQDMVDSNRATQGTPQATGGYQAGWGSDFMDGPSDNGGTSSGGNSPSDPGGSDSMGSFATGGRVGLNYGGLVSLF